MAPKCWDVDVYNINNDGVLQEKFDKRVQLKVDYDPQGLSLKIVSGKFDITLFTCYFAVVLKLRMLFSIYFHCYYEIFRCISILFRVNIKYH